MPDSIPPSGNGNGDRPTSWRDVYTLVQDVEKRLTDRLDESVSSMRQTTSDHEHRIRTVENAGTSVAQSAQTIATANALRITALEAANVIRVARHSGIMAVGNATKAVLLVTIGFVAPLVTTIFLRIILPQH